MTSKMEDYLHHMKNLRSHIRDVEDNATEVSVEEQMQITTLQTLEKDLNSAKIEIGKLKEDFEQLLKSKDQICSHILEKQRKITSLESDSSTLCQSLELIQQERDSLSTQLASKSSYYAMVAEDLRVKMQQRQNDNEGKTSAETLYSAKSKLEGIKQKRFDLSIKINKMNQSIELVRSKAEEFKPELFSMDSKTMEKEYNAILSDKTGETENLESLQSQIKKLGVISCVINCACGEQYNVRVDDNVPNDRSLQS